MGLGQNGVVLALFEPKGRRFGSAFFFFGILPIPKRRFLDKRFGYVKASSKRRRFGPEIPKRRRFVIYLKKKKIKRRRFISSRDKTTSFRQPPCPN